MTLTDTKDTVWYLLVQEAGAETKSSDVAVCILNSAIRQSMIKDWLPTIFMGYEKSLPGISADNRRGSDSSDQSVNG